MQKLFILVSCFRRILIIPWLLWFWINASKHHFWTDWIHRSDWENSHILSFTFCLSLKLPIMLYRLIIWYISIGLPHPPVQSFVQKLTIQLNKWVNEPFCFAIEAKIIIWPLLSYFDSFKLSRLFWWCFWPMACYSGEWFRTSWPSCFLWFYSPEPVQMPSILAEDEYWLVCIIYSRSSADLRWRSLSLKFVQYC